MDTEGKTLTLGLDIYFSIFAPITNKGSGAAASLHC